MLDAALVRHWLQPDWQVPGVRAWCTTRAGQLSRPPYDGFNTASHVGDDPESVARCRRALADYFAWSRPPQWLRQVHGIEVFNHSQNLLLDPQIALKPLIDDIDALLDISKLTKMDTPTVIT